MTSRRRSSGGGQNAAQPSCHRSSDAWMTSDDGFQIVEQMVQILSNYDCPAQALVASVRKFDLLIARRRSFGAWVATVPLSILRPILHQPLTDKGLDAFLADWCKTSHEDRVSALQETVSRRRRGTVQREPETASRAAVLELSPPFGLASKLRLSRRASPPLANEGSC